MKRFILTTALLGLWLSAFAQPGTVYSIPAGNPDGKLISMEDAVYSGKVYPRRYKSPSRTKFETPEGYYVCDLGQKLTISDKNGDYRVVAESQDGNISFGSSVSRNEFGINNGIFWSPSGKRLAFYRKDESLVTTFPLLNIGSRTGTLVEIKYPMAGMESERISLGIYDIDLRSTVYVKVEDFKDDRYLTNVSWSPDDKYVFIQVLDRSQKHMRLNMYRADNGEFVRTILTEDNSKYVEPQDPLYFLKGSYNFIYRTANRDGYRNLYLCDTLGTVSRLTKVDADVAYVANDGRYVYYTSAEVSPVENHLFRLDTRKDKVQRLTPERGWHNVAMNDDCTEFTDTYSSFSVPRVVLRRKADGKLIETLMEAENPLGDYARVEVTLGTVKSADGKYDNWYRMFKPLNFDPTKKYPVVVYVYGGPHSQMVNDSWLGNVRMWEYLMAQRGYIVYVQDNRGTENRGLEFEQAIHRQCGQAEMADQMVGVEMLKSLPYVDASRIGVHGWSYGGFMTISLMTNYPETFKVGVAGGPVIDWKWYEVMYGERYMETPDSNPEGYEKTSLINKAADLKGKLLICQGAIDKTVVWEHSLSFVQKCIENNVQVDYFPYPCAEHNV
ncbi:MAG: DPP IV N-terminal domain-containing protein, partial [Bacteroidales bacterium]|nr:DPP IV N-terminal domain-containing protein [Bacteroidales bacterium]